jgi:hypothetical protein
MFIGPVQIVAAPEENQPFDVEALAIEEDTWRIMSAEPQTCDPNEHPIRIMTQMIEAGPEKVGAVLTHGKDPVRFLAIVHDVDQEPSFREEWLLTAIKNVFLGVEQRGLKSLGLPFLGTRHGRLDTRRFIVLLSRILTETTFHNMTRLWLITPQGKDSITIESLKSLAEQNEPH